MCQHFDIFMSVLVIFAYHFMRVYDNRRLLLHDSKQTFEKKQNERVRSKKDKGETKLC